MSSKRRRKRRKQRGGRAEGSSAEHEPRQPQHGRASGDGGARGRTPHRREPKSWAERFTQPEPLIRLELVRILAPLVILGFLSHRMVHADYWLGDAGFRVPPMPAGDWRQPLYVPALPDWAAWGVCVLLVVSGLAVSAGFRTRAASGSFFVLLVFVALSDRLAAFTVNKIAPVIALALLLSPAGSRLGVDAWLEQRRSGVPPPELTTPGAVRFLQGFLIAMYCASGVCKMRGDWLDHPLVLWTHLHDSYQTPVSHLVANVVPAWGFTTLQGVVLAFEVLAPLWLLWRSTRPFAVVIAIGMHASIGMMFGPVIWFSLLMIVLVASSWSPIEWLPPWQWVRWPRLRATESH